MRQSGIVTETKGEFATVEVMQTSACAGCSKQEGCVHCKKRVSCSAYNPIAARKGDRVILESSSAVILLYAVLVFILPLLLCGLSYYLLGFIALPKLLRFIISTCIFVLIYVIIYFIADRRENTRKTVRIIAILDERPE